jgi:hypothetical protein
VPTRGARTRARPLLDDNGRGPAPAAHPTSSGPVPLTVAIDGRGERITLAGALGIRTLAETQKLLRPWRARGKRATLDIGKLSDLDTSGALLLSSWMAAALMRLLFESTLCLAGAPRRPRVAAHPLAGTRLAVAKLSYKQISADPIPCAT